MFLSVKICEPDRFAQVGLACYRWQMALDINTATAAELDSIDALHGHGFEIVRYREQRGRFTSLRQLDEVPGLARKTDADDLEHLTV